MNTPARLACWAASTLIAAGAGFWQGSRNQSRRPASSLADLQHCLARVRQENQWLRAENTRLASATPRPTIAPAPSAAASPAARPARQTTVNDRPAILPSLLNLPAPFFGPTLISPQGKLMPSFDQRFALTPAERDKLQQLLDAARTKLDLLATTGARIDHNGGRLVVTVGAFDGGMDVYDSLMDQVAALLGPTRNAAFVASAGDELAAGMHGFGAEARTITFGRSQRDARTPIQIWVQDDRQTGPARKRSTSSSYQSDVTLASLAQRYPWLGSALDAIPGLPLTAFPISTAPKNRG